jgi:aspartyl protease family protein
MTAPAPRRRPQIVLWILMALIVAILVAVAANNGATETFGLKNHDLVQFGYLVVILIFVGSALLGRNLGAGEVIRATAGWLAVFLVLVGAYAYRGELLGVAGRLIGVLAPGVPVSGRLAGEAEGAVVVMRTLDGHFEVRADVDQVPLALMVDTGASFVTLTTEDAARVGVDTAGLHFTVPIRTANGMIEAAPVTVDRIKLGSIVRENVPALVAPPDSLDQSLLGMSFLNTLAGYAISGDRLVLTP